VGILRRLWIIAIGMAFVPGPLMAQTEPADPLALLKQEDQDRAESTVRAARMQVSAQRQRLNQMHGTNGAGRQADKAPALAEMLTEQQVRKAMESGAAFLLKKLCDGGRFRGIAPAEQHPWISFAGDQRVGVSSLALYSLIETAKATGDPRLAPSSREMKPLVDWLIAARTHQTYSAALQACALAALPQSNEVRFALKKVRDELQFGMRADGAFSYSLNEVPPQWDNSNTQYALLGMWAVADAGLDVQDHFWNVTDAHWRRTQAPSGGWAYVQPDPSKSPGDDGKTPTPALTAAGVASLYVTLDHRKETTKIYGGDPALDRGLAAVAADFPASLPMLGDDLYYTFALQRVGIASGLKHIDGIDWYRRAAAAIILSQRNDGGWSYAYSEITGTAYALLVLAHGGSPAMIGKLAYPSATNAYPLDAAHLVHRIGQLVEQPLNWEIADIATDPSDWLDAPVLLVTGKGDPHFDAGQLRKLGDFIHAGGLIFSVAQEGDPAFTSAMQKDALIATGKKYAGRRLPFDHPLFTLQEKMADAPELWGVSNGVRELWVHSPEDLAGVWQHSAFSDKAAWAVPMNLYVYVTGKNPPRSRLNGLVLTEPPRDDNAGSPLMLARLQYDGNWDPEPGAWPRLAKIASARTSFAVTVRPQEIAALDAAQTPIAQITGTELFTLDAAAQKHLVDYLAAGGTLIGDASGGSEDFAASFVELARSLAPGAERELLPADHLLFSGAMRDSVPLDRDHTVFRKSTPPGRRSTGRPELWAWKINPGGGSSAGRYAILFSPLDITSGLLGTETWGIAGYSPQTSQDLACDMLLFVANVNRSAATRPQ